MLYFLVTFVVLITFKQWNPLISPQAVIHHSDDSGPSEYPRQEGYHNTGTCATYDSFPSIDPTFDHQSIWHHYYNVTGRKTHNTGCMTHNMAGQVTHHTPYALFVPCSYHFMPGCMTSYPNIVWHCNITSSCGMMNKSFYPSYHCHHIIMTASLNPSKKTGDGTTVFKQQCSKSVTVSIYDLPHKHYSNSWFDQKLTKHYSCSVLSLNGTFNQACDVDHLINRLLLMLQRYITRRHDFKCHWFALLLSGLLGLLHNSIWFLIVFVLKICVAAWKVFWF